MTEPRIEDFVCFAMYTASNATSKAYRQVLAPWNLTYTQYLVLVVLATGERTVSALSDELGLDSGTLSPLLKRLEDRDLVTRARAAEDERVVRVSLTEEGRTTRQALTEAVGCLVPAFTAPGASLPELMRGLRAITDGMREITTAQREVKTAQRAAS